MYVCMSSSSSSRYLQELEAEASVHERGLLQQGAAAALSDVVVLPHSRGWGHLVHKSL